MSRDRRLGMAGGTMETVIEEVLNRGGSESFTKVISIVAAPDALRRLSPNYPSMLTPPPCHLPPCSPSVQWFDRSC